MSKFIYFAILITLPIHANYKLKWKSSRKLGQVSFYNNIQFFNGVIYVGSYGIDSWDPDSLDRLWAIDAKTGRVLWSKKLPEDVLGIFLGDVNSDGYPELLVSSSINELYCFDLSGNLLWKFKGKGEHDGFTASATVADIDRDGQPEILVGSTDYNFYALDSHGKLKWKFKTGDYVYSSAAAADIDGDGEIEVIFGSDDNYLYALNSKGKLEWKFETGDYVESSPALADIDGDGKIEILFGSDDGYLYCASGGGNGTILWAKFRGDAYNTGLLSNALSYGDWARNPVGMWHPGWRRTPPSQQVVATGNKPSETPPPQPVVMDKTPPEIEILTPELKTGRAIAVVPAAGSAISITGIAMDESGIALVTVNSVTATLTPIQNGAAFAASIPLPPGTHKIKVKAVDGAGNVSTVSFNLSVSHEAVATGGSQRLPTIWALVVGISKYKDSSLNLDYADDDADLFANFLKGPHVGLPKDHVIVLKNREATRANIIAQIERVMRRAGPNDLVLIYISAHGIPYGRTLYLIPHDGDPENIGGTCASEFDILNALSFTQSKRILFIFDACHSGDFNDLYAMFVPPGTPTRRVRSEYAIRLNELMSEMARTRSGFGILSSTSGVSLAQEGRRWGGGHGAFTWYLVKGLEGAADANNDGIVTLGEVFNYTRKKVGEDTNYEQSPRLIGGDDSWPLSIVR